MITFDSLYTEYTKALRRYSNTSNLVWIMNTDYFTYIRQLTDSDGQHVWTPHKHTFGDLIGLPIKIHNSVLRKPYITKER